MVGNNTGNLRALYKSDFRQGQKKSLFLNPCLFHVTVGSAYEVKDYLSKGRQSKIETNNNKKKITV
jgi:hypothetical protein